MPETTALVYGRDTTLAWQAAVKAKGGLPIVFPSQAGASLVRKPAERYPAAIIAQLKLGEPVLWTVGKQFGYYKAGAATGAAVGAKVNALDTVNRAQLATNIVVGEAAEGAENIAKAVRGQVLLLVGVVAAVGFAMLGGGGRSKDWR